MSRKKKAKPEAPKSLTVEITADQLMRMLGIRGYLPDVCLPAKIDESGRLGIELKLDPDLVAKQRTEFESDHVVVGETGTLHQHGRAYVCTAFLPKVDESTVTESD